MNTPEAARHKEFSGEVKKSTLRTFHHEAKQTLLRAGKSGYLKKRKLQGKVGDFTLKDHTALLIRADRSWTGKKTTTCEVIDPKPIHEKGEIVYHSFGLRIDEKRGVQQRIKGVYEKDIMGNYSLKGSQEYHFVSAQVPLTEEEVRNLITKMKQVNEKTRSRFGRSIEEEDLTVTKEIVQKTRTLFSEPIPTVYVPEVGDLLLMDKEEGELFQRRIQHKRTYSNLSDDGSHDTFGYVTRTYLNAEGQKVRIIGLKGFKQVSVDVGLPQDEANYTSYTFSENHAYVHTIARQGESAEDFSLDVTVASPETYDPLTQEDREYAVKVVEGLVQDIHFGKKIQEQLKQLFISKELQGKLARKKDSLRGDLVTIDYVLENGEKIAISARQFADGTIEEAGIEQWHVPQGVHPDKIATRMYYFDFTQTSPIIIGRNMNHHLEFSREDIRHDPAWGKDGLSVREKLKLYDDPQSRKQYKIEPSERDRVLELIRV